MVARVQRLHLLPILDFKEMGIGLAAAILIDATIVRAVLLPATMTLLGDRNWYLPSWLSWLPRLGEGKPDTGAVPPARLTAPAMLGRSGPFGGRSSFPPPLRGRPTHPLS